MPMQSKAQNAAMHAAASGNSTIGIPKSVGQKFVGAQAGKPVSGLPKKVAPAKSNHRTSRSSASPFALKKKPPVDDSGIC